MCPESWEALVSKNLCRGLRTGTSGSAREICSATSNWISITIYYKALTKGSGILMKITFRVNMLHYHFSKLTPPPSTLICLSLRFLTQIKLLPSKAKNSIPPCLRRGQSPITPPRTPPSYMWRKKSRHPSLKKKNPDGAMPRRSPPPLLLQGAGTLKTQT